jgi:hypothetical protein
MTLGEAPGFCRDLTKTLVRAGLAKRVSVDPFMERVSSLMPGRAPRVLETMRFPPVIVMRSWVERFKPPSTTMLLALTVLLL